MSVDVVIVGAGSAGCVLAARLSEDPARQVLLLEAGPDYPTRESLPPEMANGHTLTVSHDWGFASGTIKVPRPRVVGGSSTTNATIALRGLPSDYDEWAALGNPGWAFRDVLPFFKKLETDRDCGDDWHGKRGPLPIRRYLPEEWTPVQSAFLEAAWARGHARVGDLNAPGALGAGALPMNTEGGIRQSAALTYLAPARARPNLTIRSRALVDQVVFEGNRAIGVRLANSGEMIFAGRVVLSAGTYCSPLILLRSGVNLPGVGAGLLDHPLWPLRFSTARPAAIDSVPLFQTMLVLDKAQVFPTSAVPCGILQSSTGGIFSLNVSPMKPRSKGRVSLASMDPNALPRIEFDYLSSPQDMATLLEAVSTARELAATPPLANLAIRPLFPSQDIEALVRRTVTTYHHPVGTCRMGPDPELGAVVNARVEVHGRERLSVVDASIMPTIPSSNIHLPTLMVAERSVEYVQA